MRIAMRLCPFLVFAFIAAVQCVLSAAAQEPLTNAHSHNDYWRERPLLDALDHRFISVEADIFLEDGKLLVGHDRDALRSERSLDSLYLALLSRRVQQNGGNVYKGQRQFFLLIDIKSNAPETYAALSEELARHADILTTVDNGRVRQGPITVVISGNQPREELRKANPRYAGFDGRLSDLDSDEPAHLMPMISDNWRQHFRWTGNGPMPESERAKLKAIVSKAHDAGRVIRFWATPENEAVWRELHTAGVDLINTDQLGRLAAFLDGASSN
jgi:hypothetical protein